MAAHTADAYWFTIGERPILQVEDSGPEVRQVEGLPVTGEVTPDVRVALQTANRPQARGTGDLVEVDKSRQVFGQRLGAARGIGQPVGIRARSWTSRSRASRTSRYRSCSGLGTRTLQR